jgi:hypothetical protein
MAARLGENLICLALHIRVRIGYNHRAGHQWEAGQIVDIIANIDRFFG